MFSKGRGISERERSPVSDDGFVRLGSGEYLELFSFGLNLGGLLLVVGCIAESFHVVFVLS